jgi:hypothetical protein
MVHHGYKRPGHGYIIGDCAGVNQLPYEVSCDLIKVYVVRLGNLLTEKKAALVDLESGKVTRITTSRVNYNGQITTTVFIAGVTEFYRWKDAVQHRTYDLKGTIRQIESDIERLTKRIAAWEPKPVRTIEEEQAKEQAAKDTRKAREDKKAATAAKQAALQAKREVIVEGLRAEFRALAQQPKSTERDAAVRVVCDKVHSKKFSWLWMHDLCGPIVETLVAIELVEKLADGRISYKSPLVH